MLLLSLGKLLKPHEDNWTKLNADAAYDNHKARWVVVARDPVVNFKGCGTNSHVVLSPTEVETRAILLATEFADVTRLQRVIIESDDEIVIKMLRYKILISLGDFAS